MSQNSELDESDLNKLEETSKPQSTNNATKSGVKKFTTWLVRRGLECDWATVSPDDLNGLLRRFYAEVKHNKVDRSLAPSSYTGLRAAIHRHITSPPYSRNLNVIRDKEFTSSNNMFTAQCKLYYKNSNPKPVHKPSITEADMALLGSYFSRWKTTPPVLVEAVWFHLCYYFGRRGREGWCGMNKDTFTVKLDSESIECVAMNKTEITKNHQGGHRQRDQDYSDQRMYGEGVDIFKFYASKLNPACGRFFQTPLKVYNSDGTWFKNEPMGKNSLGSLMQKLSQKAGLSMVYTCHSVRASTVTTLLCLIATHAERRLIA